MGVNKVTLLQEAILSLSKEINKNGEATKQQAKELKKLKEQYEKVNKLMPQYRKKHEEINKELENANKITSKLDKTNKGFFGKLKTAIGTLARYGLAYKALNATQRIFTELTIGSVKQSIAFEKALASLGAVAGATSEEVEVLGKNALSVAGSTKFTAIEIVGLQTELSKLGFTAEDVVASTQAIAFTAQALGAPLDAVAQQTGKVINQFDLLIEQAGFVGDVLVTSINNSALSFDSFGTAIQYVGPIAKNLGLTIEQTAGAMAVLADNGFTASRVGTGLRGIFTELGKTSADVEASLNSLAKQNISLSEAVDLVGKRNAAQLITLLKNIDAIDKGNEKYYEQGRALQSAAKDIDNFAGQMKLLNAAFIEFQINIGESIANSDILLSVLDAFFPAAGKTARGFQAINEVGFEAFNAGAKEVEKGAGSLNKSLELLGVSQEEYQQSLEALNRTETSFLDYLPDGFSKIGDAALAQVQKVDGFRLKLEEVAEESKKQTLITEGQTIATDEYEESVRRLTQAFEDQINVNDEVDITAERINSQISEYNAIINTGVRTQTDAFGIRSEMVEVTEDEIIKYKGLVGALQGYLDQLTNISFSEDDLNRKRESERKKAIREEKENIKEKIKIENESTANLVKSINERAKQQTAVAETAQQEADIEAKRAAAVSEAYRDNAKTIAGLVPVYEENIDLVENAVKANEKLSEVLGSEVINDVSKAFDNYSSELRDLKKAQEDGTLSQEGYERAVAELRNRFIETIETFRTFAGTSQEVNKFLDDMLINFDALSITVSNSTEKSKKDWEDFTKEFKETAWADIAMDAVNALGESLGAFNDVALENTKNRLAQDMEEVKNRYEIEDEILKSQLNNQLITESQFRKKQKDLRKIQVAEENAIAKELFNAEKKQDRNDAALDGVEAAAQSYLQAFQNYEPVTAAIVGSIGAGIALAQSTAQIGAINSRKYFDKKFADGGVVNGPSHAEGGVPFSVQGRGGYEMEGGEYIINKRATSMHRDLLDKINNTGLNASRNRQTKFAVGGVVGAVTGLASVDYLEEIAMNTAMSANNSSKPVRAYVADKDLNSNNTERKIRDRNDRI
jgi:DNA repair exonuclease SbcCD ATPase subunit